MKTRRLLTTLLLIIFSVFPIAGCTPTTEFDDMEISRIETTLTEGFMPFNRHFLRTFDFKHGKVYDTRVAETDDLPEEVLPASEKGKYNNPTLVASFDFDKATALYEKIKSLGFLAWKDEYVTDDIICDGGSERVTVYFSDGTVKSTLIYFKYPENYDKILNAFKEYFGVNFYYEW